MKQRHVLLMALLVICTLSAFAQQTVTGYVFTADDREPILGATVMATGTKIGAATDINGKFTLTNVPNSARSVVVSYVGMKSQTVTIKPEMNIYLEPDARSLDEVVVQVAYGSAKKSTLTGAVSQVGTEHIELRPVSSVTSALEGTTSEASAVSDALEAASIVLEKQADTRSKIAAAGALRLERRGNRILLFNSTVYLTLYNQKSYILTIPQCGKYAYPLGQLEVYPTANGIFVRDSEDKSCGVGPFTLPISVRSRRGGDRIQMKSGNVKEVKKILNEWQVDSLARELLPIIIEDTCIRRRTRIRALYGSFLGYKNWFVEEQ